jgi:hypothetical protein
MHAFIAALAIVASAQNATPPQTDSIAIARAVVEHASRSYLQLPVTVDAYVLGVNAPSTVPMNGPQHSAALLRAVAIDSVATVASTDLSRQCTIPVAPACKTNGKAVFVTLSHSRIAGDTAVMRMWIRSARDLTPEDSARVREAHRQGEARIRAPGYRGSGMNMTDSTRMFDRMERPAATHVEFTVARRDGRWTVVKTQILGQT